MVKRFRPYCLDIGQSFLEDSNFHRDFDREEGNLI